MQVVCVCVCVLQILTGGSFTMASERNPSRQLVCLPFSETPPPNIKAKTHRRKTIWRLTRRARMLLLRMSFGLNSFQILHYQRKYMHPVSCMETQEINLASSLPQQLQCSVCSNVAGLLMAVIAFCVYCYGLSVVPKEPCVNFASGGHRYRYQKFDCPFDMMVVSVLRLFSNRCPYFPVFFVFPKVMWQKERGNNENRRWGDGG